MKSLIKLCLGAAVAVSLSTAAVAGPFNETDQCSSCAMVIKKYPGPKGLLVLKDKSVQKFCSARGTACGYAAAMKRPASFTCSCMTPAPWIGKIPTTQS